MQFFRQCKYTHITKNHRCRNEFSENIFHQKIPPLTSQISSHQVKPGNKDSQTFQIATITDLVEILPIEHDDTFPIFHLQLEPSVFLQ